MAWFGYDELFGSTLEDKIVQKATAWILEAIYEVDFAGVQFRR